MDENFELNSYHLRWKNHQTTMLNNFNELLEKEILVDCTLNAEGKTIKAHKIILSTCSGYFQKFLNDFNSEKHPVFFLKDIKFHDLQALMNYMYKGETFVPGHQLVDFLNAADYLQIQGICQTDKVNDEDYQDLSLSNLKLASNHESPRYSNPEKALSNVDSHQEQKFGESLENILKDSQNFSNINQINIQTKILHDLDNHENNNIDQNMTLHSNSNLENIKQTVVENLDNSTLMINNPNPNPNIVKNLNHLPNTNKINDTNQIKIVKDQCDKSVSDDLQNLNFKTEINDSNLVPNFSLQPSTSAKNEIQKKLRPRKRKNCDLTNSVDDKYTPAVIDISPVNKICRVVLNPYLKDFNKPSNACSTPKRKLVKKTEVVKRRSLRSNNSLSSKPESVALEKIDVPKTSKQRNKKATRDLNDNKSFDKEKSIKKEEIDNYNRDLLNLVNQNSIFGDYFHMLDAENKNLSNSDTTLEKSEIKSEESGEYHSYELNDENKNSQNFIKKYSCKKCNKSYCFKFTLTHHLKYLCGNPKLFKCFYCPFRANTKGNITSHIHKCHKDEAIKFSILHK